MTAESGKKATAYFDMTRVVAYTDAVFAIAATLLVLDLTTKTVGNVQSDAELWAALRGMWPTFLSFGISFTLLSGLWVLHLRQFRDIERADIVLLWINNARLLLVVLIPFTTSLVDEYSQFLAARVLLPINFFLAVLLGVATWTWATSNRYHLLKSESKTNAAQVQDGGLAALICGALAVVLAAWLGSWGFAAYALNGPLTALVRRMRGPAGRR